jgi:F-type H+-transporting ATPase subunit delta
MKTSKESSKLSKSLLRLSMTAGKIDAAKVKEVLSAVALKKPRNYLSVLKGYQRLVRLEAEKSHAVIQTATKFDKKSADVMEKNLRKKFGEDLTCEFQIHPELISGVRIKIGSTVWENSVRGRLDGLEAQLS